MEMMRISQRTARSSDSNSTSRSSHQVQGKPLLAFDCRGNRQGIDDEEIKAICMKLCELPDLKSLYLKLNENKIGNNGLAVLGKYLEMVQLRSLEIYIRGNQYDDKGAKFLISQICKHVSLENLKISFWK